MPVTPEPRLLIIVPAWNEEETVGVGHRRGPRDRPRRGRARGQRRLHRPHHRRSPSAAGATRRSTCRSTSASAARCAPATGTRCRAGYDVTVQLDADGQHDPAEVPVLLVTMVVARRGHRHRRAVRGRGRLHVRGPRRWTMRSCPPCSPAVAGTRLTDTTSGFKACDRAAIELFAANYPAEYLGDTIESLVIAARAGLRRPPGRRRACGPDAGGRPSHSPVKAAVFLAAPLLALADRPVAGRRARSPPKERPRERVPRSPSRCACSSSCSCCYLLRTRGSGRSTRHLDPLALAVVVVGVFPELAVLALRPRRRRDPGQPALRGRVRRAARRVHPAERRGVQPRGGDPDARRGGRAAPARPATSWRSGCPLGAAPTPPSPRTAPDRPR